MKNKKTTKRALLLSALSLLLCMAMLVGSTFAWFTDSVTSGRNTIVSGQLDVTLEYATMTNGVWSTYAPVDENTKVFSETALYEPGYTEVVKFRVTNAGTLALKYNLDAKIYNEVAGTNVYNESFNLSEYLYTGTLAAADYTREAAVAAATTKLADGVNLKAATQLLPGAVEEIVLVLTMPTTVGNEANHIDGAQPKIDLGIALVATQATYEADDFDNLYDDGAVMPLTLSANADVVAGGNTNVAIAAPGTKLPAISASVPAAAVEAGATDLVLTVKEQTSGVPNIALTADQVSTTYDIEITGVADTNTADITVTMNIGTGLTGVKLYHNTTEIPCSYDAATGILTFTTTSFSPYTVVCDANLAIEVKDASELATAINNVKAGGKVILVADVTVTETINVTKDMTLDLNGQTLTCNVNKARALKIASGVNFTLDAEGSSVAFGNGTYGIIDIADAGVATAVTVNGGTFAGTSDGGCLVKLRNGTDIVVTLNNVNYTENAAVNKSGMINSFVMDTNGKAGNWTVNINGGVYNVACGINVATTTKLTMTGVTLNARGSGIEAGNATISGCKITLDPGSYVYSAEGACVSVNNGGLITVKDSTLISGTYATAVYSSTNAAGEFGTINLINCNITAPAIDAYPEYGTVDTSDCSVVLTK